MIIKEFYPAMIALEEMEEMAELYVNGVRCDRCGGLFHSHEITSNNICEHCSMEMLLEEVDAAFEETYAKYVLMGCC